MGRTAYVKPGVQGQKGSVKWSGRVKGGLGNLEKRHWNTFVKQRLLNMKDAKEGRRSINAR